MTREEMLVNLVARVLVLPDDRPRLVAIDGTSCVGKTTLADELAVVLEEAGLLVVRVSGDDFHQPREVRHRRGRLSAEGYLEDSYDLASLRRLVLDPARKGEPSVRTASYDLAADAPVTPEPVELTPSAVVLVEGEFLLVPELAEAWDLGIMLVADPAVILARALDRDADLGSPDEVRERYLRRYLGAWALHEERHDPWSLADVVVDLSDPGRPRVLG